MKHMIKIQTLLGAIIALLALISCGGGGAAPPAPTILTDTVTDGTVYAIAVAADGTTYIGGPFTEAGPATGTGLPISMSTGKASTVYPKVVGNIYAVAPGGNGGWYIGGSLNYVGGVRRNNIAPILSNGTVDPNWDPDAKGIIRALAVSGGTVYAGGEFTLIGTGPTVTARNHIAAIDAATGAAFPWNLNANGPVITPAVSGSTVYAGGGFSSIGTGPTLTTRNNIAAIDMATGAATSGDPNANYAV